MVKMVENGVSEKFFKKLLGTLAATGNILHLIHKIFWTTLFGT